MKNHYCVIFLIASVFLEIGLCNKNVVKDNVHQESREQMPYDNHYLGRVPEQNLRKYIEGTHMINIAGSLRPLIESLYDKKNGHRHLGKEIPEGKGFDFGFDAGNPDVHGEISRPCQAYDTFCIQKFLAEHSNCKISSRPVPDPLFRVVSHEDHAIVNMSLIVNNEYVSGLNNARITEFYVNKVSDNLVMAVTFKNVERNTNNTFLKYYLKGREPIVAGDVGRIQYGTLTITVIIPQLHNLRLDRSTIFTYGDDQNYSFVLGPGVATSTDPAVPAMFATFLARISQVYITEIIAKGPSFIGNFIQYNICDFGVIIS